MCLKLFCWFHALKRPTEGFYWCTVEQGVTRALTSTPPPPAHVYVLGGGGGGGSTFTLSKL